MTRQTSTLRCSSGTSVENLRLGYFRQVIEFAGENLSAAQYDAFRAFCQSGGDLGGAVRMLAAETGRSERTIRTHISRALRRIRREMEGEICD